MKLSQDILLYQLAITYPVCSLNCSTLPAGHSYPILYENGMELSDHVVVISAHDLESLPDEPGCGAALFVCVGQLEKHPSCGEAVIVIEQDVPLVRISNYLSRVFNTFEKWDQSLKSVLYENGSFQELINCCDNVIVEPIAIVDKEFQMVASSALSAELGYGDHVDDDNRLSLDAFNNFITAVDYAYICKMQDYYELNSSDGKSISRNIFNKDGEYAGRIAIKLNTEGNDFQRYNQAILEHLYIYAEQLFNKYSSFDIAEISKNSAVNILQDSLNNKLISEKQWEQVLQENGWDTRDQLRLIQFRPRPNKEKNLYAKYLSFKVDKKWQGSICFIYMDHLLMLSNMNKFSDSGKLDFFLTLAYFLRDNLLIAGVSRAFRGIKHLRSAYEQTETAIEYGSLKDTSFWYHRFDDYVLDYMIQSCKNGYEPEEICSNKLLALMEHDSEKGTEYYKTLHIYIECKFNAAESAKRLFINRSTFHYRLDRIQELVNINFDSSDERLYLAISFKILDK